MIQIRLATPEDITRLSHIYVDTYNDARLGEDWTQEHAHIMLSYFYKLQPDLFFVAHEGDTLAGAMVGVIKPWWDGPLIFDGELFVSPQFQKKGVGKKLLTTLVEEAVKKHDVKYIEWQTFNKSFHLEWYQKMGFQILNRYTIITGEIDNLRTALSSGE